MEGINALFISLGVTLIGFCILVFALLDWYIRLDRVGKYLHLLDSVLEKVHEVSKKCRRMKVEETVD